MVLVRVDLTTSSLILLMFELYSFVLKGHFANAVVGFLDFFIYKDYQP